jgi:hypothetical protein
MSAHENGCPPPGELQNLYGPLQYLEINFPSRATTFVSA